QRVARAERLALRPRERREGLVHQHDGGQALLPCGKSVAHGGAGTGPSGAHADDQVVDGLREPGKLRPVEWRPRVALVGALDRLRLHQRLEGLLEARPEIARGLVLVPDVSHALSEGRFQRPALGLLLPAGITQWTDQLYHVVLHRSLSITVG